MKLQVSYQCRCLSGGVTKSRRTPPAESLANRFFFRSHLAFTQLGEEDARDDEDVDEAAKHPADDRGGERLHDFGTCAGAPHDRKKAGDDGGDGHDFRAQAEACAIFDGLNEIVADVLLLWPGITELLNREGQPQAE